METWDAVRARRNVRDFTDEPLSDEALGRILEAAWRSPSSRNLQRWDFVVVTDRAELVNLAGVWQGGGHIAGAAAAVVLVIEDVEDPRTRESVLYDLGQASLQMMVVAADLGIGSGHSAVGDQSLARELLGFPETHVAKMIIDFGYPADRPLAPIARPKRRPFDEVIHRGRW
jgi:nitroreductase